MPGNETIRGHVEKKKDWIRRARDYQEKSAKLKQLKRSAQERNPDEFHFHMVRSQVGLDGVHRDLGSDTEDEEKTEAQRLLSDITDIQYVRFKLSIEQKKIEKLKAVLHFCAEGSSRPNKHIIFVDDEEEAKEFDPTKHFNTSEQFLSRTFNRPKTGEASSSMVALSENKANKLKVTEKERRRLYAELGKRVERERELRVVLQKLELKRDLALSNRSELKPKLEDKGDTTRAAVYKWTYERKK